MLTDEVESIPEGTMARSMADRAMGLPKADKRYQRRKKATTTIRFERLKAASDAAIRDESAKRRSLADTNAQREERRRG